MLSPSRRQLLSTLAGLGVGSTVFQRAVVAQAPKEGRVTEEMIKQAEWIAGLKLSDDDRKALVGRINNAQRTFDRARQVPLTNDDAGLWRFPNGAVVYRRLFRAFTTSDLRPEQILEIGLREVARFEA